MSHHGYHHRACELSRSDNGVGAAAMMQRLLYRGEEACDPGVEPIAVIERVRDVEAAVRREYLGRSGSQISRVAHRQPNESGIDLALGRVTIHALKCHGTLSLNDHHKGGFCIRSQSKIGPLSILQVMRREIAKSYNFLGKLMA
jgi:hypothetical protein